MRQAIDSGQFTPFGMFIYEHCKASGQGLSVTNLDYTIEDFKKRIIMLMEEKQSGGTLKIAQKKTFSVLDSALTAACPDLGYDYWGFYLLQFPQGKTFPGPGMQLNGRWITVEELVAHINCQKKFCPGMNLNGSSQTEVAQELR